MGLQPRWHVSGGSNKSRGVSGDLEPVCCLGINGLVTILACLFFWCIMLGIGKCLWTDQANRSEKVRMDAVDAVAWVLRSLGGEHGNDEGLWCWSTLFFWIFWSFHDLSLFGPQHPNWTTGTDTSGFMGSRPVTLFSFHILFLHISMISFLGSPTHIWCPDNNVQACCTGPGNTAGTLLFNSLLFVTSLEVC